MNKLALVLTGVLLVPARVIGQPEPSMGQMILDELHEATSHGERGPFYRVRVTNDGDGESQALLNMQITLGINATIDPANISIFNGDLFGSSAISPGGWREFTGEDKMCQNTHASGEYYVCMTLGFDTGSLSTCSSTPVTCVDSGNLGPAVLDDPQSGDLLDPISTLTGAFFKQFPPDFDLGGPMPFGFSRYYSSGYIKTARHASALGTNWRHNFDWNLRRASAASVEVTDDRGRLIVFTSANVGATWVLSGSLDTPYQLVNGAANEFILGNPLSKLTYRFFVDPNQFVLKPHGRLTSIEDANGNTHTLSYSDKLLTAVADGLGRTLTFTYDGNRLISKVIDDQNREAVFTHGGANLRELLTSKDPMLNITTYTYDAGHALPGLMTAYVRPEGNTPRSQTYEAGTGRVLAQTSMGHTNSLAYAGALTTVTDPATKTLQHTHSGTGELTNVKDKSGNAFSLSYDAVTKRRVGETDTLAATTGYTYHSGSGRPASIAHANGETTSFAHTSRALGNLIQYDRTMITHADGTTDKAAFDANGNLKTRTDRADNKTTFTYNTRGQVLTRTNPETAVNTWTYNADGTAATRKDAFNNTTTFAYDEKRRRKLVSFADATTKSFTYDNNDRLTSSTDRRGHTATYTYDGNSSLKTITDRAGDVRTYTYDALDRIVSVEDTSVTGKPTRITTYDNLERLKNVTDPNGNKTRFSYDALNRLTGITDPLLKNWQLTYDKEDILASTTNPLGHVDIFTSDVMGRMTQEKNPLDNMTDLTHDSMGRVVTITDPMGDTTTLAYDPRGLISSRTLSGGVSASYTRNTLGQITRVTDPRGKFWNHAYTKGRLTSRTDPLGRSIGYTYDSMNRKNVVSFPAALGTLTHTYDDNGNITRRLFSGPGPDLNYTFDNMDRMLTTDGLILERDTLGRITKSNDIDTSYDAGGRMASVDLDIAGSTKTITYTYDSNDRLTSVADWIGGSTTFTYDDADRLLTITRPNTVISTYTYDNDSKVLSITEKLGPTVISSHNFVRDTTGQISTATRNVVTGPTISESSAMRSYDFAGQINGFTYDDLGRLDNDNSGVVHTWDLASRIMSTDRNGTISRFTYDGLGQRLSKTVGGANPRSYVWNQALKLPSIAIEKDSEANVRYYIHTPSGRFLHSIDVSGNARHFYHFDEIGNTQFVSDDSGAVEVSYHHGPYGRLLGQEGNLDHAFTWQGMWGVMDDGNGLFYARARYFDAMTHRFLSKDPVISKTPREIDPYQYAAGNPLQSGDPTGLHHESDGVDSAISGLGGTTTVLGGAASVVEAVANPKKAVGAAIAVVGVGLLGADAALDGDTAETAGDVVTVIAAGEVIVTGLATGTAAVGAGAVLTVVGAAALAAKQVKGAVDEIAQFGAQDEAQEHALRQQHNADLGLRASQKRKIIRESEAHIQGIEEASEARDEIFRDQNARNDGSFGAPPDTSHPLGDILFGESSYRTIKPPSNSCNRGSCR